MMLHQHPQSQTIANLTFPLAACLSCFTFSSSSNHNIQEIGFRSAPSEKSSEALRALWYTRRHNRHNCDITCSLRMFDHLMSWGTYSAYSCFLSRFEKAAVIEIFHCNGKPGFLNAASAPAHSAHSAHLTSPRTRVFRRSKCASTLGTLGTLGTLDLAKNLGF